MDLNHPHPFTIWQSLSSFSLFLIFPVVQSIFQTPLSSVAVNNLPWMLSVVALAWMGYRNNRWGCSSTSFFHSYGILRTVSQEIPFANIRSVFIKTSPVLSIFGAAQLRLDTAGGGRRRPDLKLYLSRKPLLRWWERQTGRRSPAYRAKPASLLLTTAAWSNPATGLLLASAFLNRAAKILGEEVSEELFKLADQRERLIALGIPPAVAGVGYLFAAGWLIAFLRQFSRYAGLSATLSGSNLAVSRGFPVKNRHLIRPEAIGAITLTQTLLMKALGLSSLFLHTQGSGKEEGDRGLLLAAVKSQELQQYLSLFTPEFCPDAKSHGLCPSPGALAGFLMAPLVSGLSLLAFQLFFGQTAGPFSFLFFFLWGLILWLFAVRILAFRHSFLSVENHKITAGGYRGLHLYTACFPAELLQSVTVSQTPFQRFSNRCSLVLHIGAERHAAFRVKNLNLQQVSALISNDLH